MQAVEFCIVKKQERIKSLQGKLKWDDDLDKMRLDYFNGLRNWQTDLLDDLTEFFDVIRVISLCLSQGCCSFL